MDGDLDDCIRSCQRYSMLCAGRYLLTVHGDRHAVRCGGHQCRRFCIIRNVSIQAACSEVGIRAYSAARGQIAQLNLTFDVERIILRQRRIIRFQQLIVMRVNSDLRSTPNVKTADIFCPERIADRTGSPLLAIGSGIKTPSHVESCTIIFGGSVQALCILWNGNGVCRVFWAVIREKVVAVLAQRKPQLVDFRLFTQNMKQTCGGCGAAARVFGIQQIFSSFRNRNAEPSSGVYFPSARFSRTSNFCVIDFSICSFLYDFYRASLCEICSIQPDSEFLVCNRGNTGCLTINQISNSRGGKHGIREKVGLCALNNGQMRKLVYGVSGIFQVFRKFLEHIYHFTFKEIERTFNTPDFFGRCCVFSAKCNRKIACAARRKLFMGAGKQIVYRQYTIAVLIGNLHLFYCHVTSIARFGKDEFSGIVLNRNGQMRCYSSGRIGRDRTWLGKYRKSQCKYKRKNTC